MVARGTNVHKFNVKTCCGMHSGLPNLFQISDRRSNGVEERAQADRRAVVVNWMRNIIINSNRDKGYFDSNEEKPRKNK